MLYVPDGKTKKMSVLSGKVSAKDLQGHDEKKLSKKALKRAKRKAEKAAKKKKN